MYQEVPFDKIKQYLILHLTKGSRQAGLKPVASFKIPRPTEESGMSLHDLPHWAQNTVRGSE
jgi:hypothetical protein